MFTECSLNVHCVFTEYVCRFKAVQDLTSGAVPFPWHLLPAADQIRANQAAPGGQAETIKPRKTLKSLNPKP
jgi:hypothetical protein